MDREQIAEHLRFAAELGVSGVSRRSGLARTRASPACRADTTSQGTRWLPLLSSRDPAQALAAVRADIGDCTRCKLHTLGRRQIVFGVGNPDADLMFVGEAPGADEDVQGIPFVGRAGQLLTKIIEAIDLTRDDVYIANVIKCRPPQNRNPEPDEVETCEPFLFQQIDIIKPKVIVALGKFAAQGAAANARSHLPPARSRVRLSRRQADSHVPPGVSAAKPLVEAGGVGGHEAGQNPAQFSTVTSQLSADPQGSELSLGT